MKPSQYAVLGARFVVLHEVGVADVLGEPVFGERLEEVTSMVSEYAGLDDDYAVYARFYKFYI